MHRRDFLKNALWTTGGVLVAGSTSLAAPARRGTAAQAGGGTRPLVSKRHLGGTGEARFDIAVIGGGLGGCAAALAALRRGRTVVMTEETDWIGGQMTAQAVPPDEHPWVERFGVTRAYRELRNRIRDYYRRNYPLTEEARQREQLNPGNGGVSRLCHEPRVALACLYDMLAPYLGNGRLVLLLEHRPVGAEADGDRVRSVTVRHLPSGEELTIIAPYFLDATELGDLLPLTGTEYVTGAESQAETGELHAAAEARPANHQAFTCCFAMDHFEGEDHRIERPADYGFWRRYVPEMSPPWPGRLLSWEMSHPVTLDVRPVTFQPHVQDTSPLMNLWLYRRIADRRNFRDGTYDSDITLVNWPQNDYWLGNLYGVPEPPHPPTPLPAGERGGGEGEAAEHLRRAKQLSLSLFYWMQTDAPRPDGGTGWPGLRLRGDLVGTLDGVAKYPYIREARRIRAEFTVLEQHVGTEQRMRETGLSRDEVRAAEFADSVGVGSYRIDLHPSSGGDNYIDVSSLPFQIPLGALIPVRVENLLPACKNLGVTHITNGCYRLHPVEWNIGEAAGALAAFCLERSENPRGVRARETLLADFQHSLESEGVELAWPEGVTPR